MNRKSGSQVLFGLALVLGFAGTALAQQPVKGFESYDAMFARYLREARATPAIVPPDPWGWMNGLAVDSRARRVNDLISIRVDESITASGSADSALTKTTNTNNSITGLFGLTSKLPGSIDATALANTKNDNNFKGSGATARSGVLTTSLTARVAEVLPNGDLVIEGVREIDINGDFQIVVLTGVVRVVDLTPGNVVPSTSIGQLRVQYFGKGLMKDNLNPGFLLRMLNKIF